MANAWLLSWNPISDPAAIPEDAGYTTPSLDKLTISKTEPLSPKSSLIVADVQVFRLEDSDISTLILTLEEPFIVQVRFLLKGLDACFNHPRVFL